MNGSKYMILFVLTAAFLSESHSSEISEDIELVNVKLNDESSTAKLPEDLKANIKVKNIETSNDISKENDIYDEGVPTFTEYQKIVAEESIQKRKGVVSASVTPEPVVTPNPNLKNDISVNLSAGSSVRSNLSNSTNSASGDHMKLSGTLNSKTLETSIDGTLSDTTDTASVSTERSISDSDQQPILRRLTGDDTDELKPTLVESSVDNAKVVQKSEDVHSGGSSSSLDLTAQVPPLTTDMLMKNVAAAECSAKVLAHNPEAKNAPAVLIEDRDVYMNHPCSATKWLIIELCEPVQVRRIEIANYELFSSSPKTFNVSLAEKYPTKEWSFLGSFQARDERQLQSFPVDGEDKFVRYMTFHFVDHYGREHFCPLSTIRVFGVLTEDIDDEQPNIPNLPPVKQHIKSSASVTETEQRQTPKIAENGLELEEKTSSKLLPTFSIDEGAASVIKSSDGEKTSLKQSELKSEPILVNNHTCDAVSLINKQSYDVSNVRLSSATSNASQYHVFLTRCFLRLYSTGLSSRPSKVAALCAAIRTFPECRFYSCMSNVTSGEIARLFVHWVAFELGRRVHLYELFKLVSTDVVHDTLQPSKNTTTTAANKVITPIVAAVDNDLDRRNEVDKSVPTLMSRNVVTTPSPVTIDGSDGRLSNPAKVVPASNRKESSAAIMRLTNRVKALELNISVSMHYLEELSCSYKKQTERVKTDEEHRQRHLLALMAHWERRARTAEKRELQIRNRLLRLESRLDNVASATYQRQEHYFFKQIFSQVAIESVRKDFERLINRVDQVEALFASSQRSQRGLVKSQALRRIYQSSGKVILDRSFGGIYLWIAVLLIQCIIILLFLRVTGWRRCVSCTCHTSIVTTDSAAAAALSDDGFVLMKPSVKTAVLTLKNRKEEKRRRVRHDYLQKSIYSNGNGHSHNNSNGTTVTQRWSSNIQDLIKTPTG